MLMIVQNKEVYQFCQRDSLECDKNTKNEIHHLETHDTLQSAMNKVEENIE